MKGFLIFTTLTALLAQDPTPARPFPHHEQPPEGWFCVPGRDAPEIEKNAHACDCRGMILDDPEPHCWTDGEDAEGNRTRTRRGESPRCKVHCHQSHCHCSTRCDTT